MALWRRRRRGLVSIWFVVGSVAALLAAAAGLSLLAQIVLFLVVSVAALAATRPLVRKLSTGKAVPTNADRVLGATGKVTETIDNENSSGAVYVDGKTWTARSADGAVIPAGEPVEITSMEGGSSLSIHVRKRKEFNKWKAFSVSRLS